MLLQDVFQDLTKISKLISPGYHVMFRNQSKKLNLFCGVEFDEVSRYSFPGETLAPCVLRQYLPAGNNKLRRTMSVFTVETAVTRVMTELLPHVSQCVFMFGIAVERYILVCHPTKAKQLLTPRKRFSFCLLLTLILFLVSFPAVYDYAIVAKWWAQNTVRENTVSFLQHNKSI